MARKASDNLLSSTAQQPCPPSTSSPPLPGVPIVVSEERAARMLSLAPRTLQDMRLRGGGPSYVALTSRRVGYLVSELEAWARQRSRTSTSALMCLEGAGR
jgi:predicted DNA-binding transcriptional regulator AlpA